MVKELTKEQSTYYSVILAALLHDIGKFVQRCDTNPTSRKHHVFSREFLARLWEESPLPPSFNKELILDLVEHHHAYKDSGAHPDDLERKSFDHKNLAWLVCLADNFASGERSPDKGTYPDDFRNIPLRPVSLVVDIGKEWEKDDYSIRGQAFKLELIFPEKGTVKPSYSSDSLTKLANDLKGIKQQEPLKYISAVDSVLFKHLWGIPSDTLIRGRESIQADDISLYEHLRLTAGIASATYRYHDEVGDWYKVQDEEGNLEKYMLIGGDLSGIQRFIFGGVGFRTKGVAKRLRARSFKLQALVIAVIHKLCKDLDLPNVNVLVHSGGNFSILAHNSDKTREVVENMQEYLNKYFYDTTFMDTSLVLGTTTLAGKDFSLDNFPNKQEELFISIAENKQRKFVRQIGNGVIDQKWDPDKGLCEYCKRFEANPKLSEKDEGGIERNICDICFDEGKMGGTLVHAESLVVSEQDIHKGFNFKLGNANIHVLPATELKEIPSDSLVISLEDWLDRMLYDSSKHDSFGFLANHVPSKNGESKTFEEIVGFKDGEKQSYPDSAREGVDYIGVLKADVDNLGRIFQKGLKGEGEKGSAESVSRFLSLSRTFDSFFGGWLSAFMKRGETVDVLGEVLYPDNIYTIYAGGDDLCLVGRWDQIILMAYYVHEKFNELMCGNPNITISAGIAVTPQQYPISESVRIAEENLEKSKDGGRNRITVLNATFEWSRFRELFEFARFLRKAGEDAKGIGGAMLYRFIEYWRLGMEYKRDNTNTAALIYRARLKYDLARNLKDEETQQEIFKRFEYDNELFKYLIFPLAWAAYKSRK